MKKRRVKIIEDPKLRGEWVESVFVARANEQGLPVSKPWGESKSFDFVVGSPGNFVSVQVKSTVFECGGGYGCSVKKNNQFYEPGSFDFVAAYVIPEDAWYIVPAAKLSGKGSMILCSDAKQALYEEYREAWDLLRKAIKAEEAEAREEAKRAVGPPAGVAGRMQFAFGRLRNCFEGSSVRHREREEE